MNDSLVAFCLEYLSRARSMIVTPSTSKSEVGGLIRSFSIEIVGGFECAVCVCVCVCVHVCVCACVHVCVCVPGELLIPTGVVLLTREGTSILIG